MALSGSPHFAIDLPEKNNKTERMIIMSMKSIIATVQGQEIELTYNEATGYYEGTGQAGLDSSYPQNGGYFPVSITATDDTDLSTTVDSTHSSFGEELRLFVAETNKPVITILTPGSNGYITGNVKPEIKFEIVDNKTQTSGFSGINKESVVLKVDGVAVANSAITFETIQGGFVGSYTPSVPLENGNRTITIDGADNDGNTAETATLAFEIDNQAPGLQVFTPTNDTATSTSRVTVTGKVEDRSTPITVNITLNGVDQGEVTVNSDGTFSKNVDLSVQGDNVIKVTATDKFGNKSTEETRTVRYNTTAPRFEDVEISYNGGQVSTGNKVSAGKQYLIRCKVVTS